MTETEVLNVLQADEHYRAGAVAQAFRSPKTEETGSGFEWIVCLLYCGEFAGEETYWTRTVVIDDATGEVTCSFVSL